MFLVLLKLRREVSSADIKKSDCSVPPNGLTVTLSLSPSASLWDARCPPLPEGDLLLVTRIGLCFLSPKIQILITLALLKTNSSVFQISLTCIGPGWGRTGVL